MIKAVLLDLDDTLLDNPTEQFTRGYLGSLDRFLSEQFGQGGFLDLILTAMRAVMTSCDPLHTNFETFYDTLVPLLPVDRQAFDQQVEEFYCAVYPALQAGTSFRPGARRLVDWLLGQGYVVVVATNPFFPRVAVEQRLSWAGVAVDEVPFHMVTTLETMHFTKPRLEYYEEILARVGVQADEAIMVGDDWENDIVPAWHAGLNTFWIAPENGPCPDPAIRPDGCGTLDRFVERVRDQNWLDTLAPRPLEPAQIEPRLRGNLAAVLGVVDEIPPQVWHMRPEAEEWSPIEVLCHLRDTEHSVQRARLETILHADNPFLSQPADPPAPATQVCPEQGKPVAQAFAAERQQTLDFVHGLDAAAWNRPARHYIFGPTTLLEMANFTATHDRLHITQLCQTVGKCES